MRGSGSGPEMVRKGSGTTAGRFFASVRNLKPRHQLGCQGLSFVPHSAPGPSGFSHGFRFSLSLGFALKLNPARKPARLQENAGG